MWAGLLAKDRSTYASTVFTYACKLVKRNITKPPAAP